MMAGDEFSCSDCGRSGFGSSRALGNHRRWHRGPSVDERMWTLIGAPDTNGCWPWLGTLDDNGYGQFHAAGLNVRAHRVVFATLTGTEPGESLDHLCHTHDLTCLGGSACRHRRCVNPEHLETTTRVENSRRGVRGRAVTCVRGHLLVRLRPAASRVCRTCNRDRQRAYRERVAAC